MCCQQQRLHHRAAIKLSCGYFRDAFDCVDMVGAEVTIPIISLKQFYCIIIIIFPASPQLKRPDSFHLDLISEFRVFHLTDLPAGQALEVRDPFLVTGGPH